MVHFFTAMKRIRIGFTAVCAVTISLLAVSLQGVEGVLTASILSGLMLLLAIALILESRSLCDCAVSCRHQRGSGQDCLSDYVRKSGTMAVSVIAGVIGTYFLQRLTPLDAVMASATVGLAAHILIRPYAAAAYCGSFAGMMSTVLFPPLSMIIAALVTALFFLVLMPVLDGWGGKLGTIAYIGTLSTAILMRKEFPAMTLPDQSFWVPILIAAAAGSLSTYELQHRSSLGPVAASSLTGLTAALMLAFFRYAGLAGDETLQLSLVFFCTGFIGMSARHRVSGGLESLAAGFAAGAIFILTSTSFGGTGGKLGTIALISVLITSLIKRGLHPVLKLLPYSGKRSIND
ncbi:hypothetical protein JCM12856_05730 [Spirochaeta dissipatitropha]